MTTGQQVVPAAERGRLASWVASNSSGNARAVIERGFRVIRNQNWVVILSGFFEFTGTKYPKTKHRFTLKDSPVMAIAGLWSESDAGELSFTMLTTGPGPDIAPYHDRQVCVLRPEDWGAWLFLTKPEAELLKPLPAGSLLVETVRPGSD